MTIARFSTEKIALLYTLVDKYRLRMSLSFTAKGHEEPQYGIARRDMHRVTIHAESEWQYKKIEVMTQNHPTADAAFNSALEALARQLPSEELLHDYRDPG